MSHFTLTPSPLLLHRSTRSTDPTEQMASALSTGWIGDTHQSTRPRIGVVYRQSDRTVFNKTGEIVERWVEAHGNSRAFVLRTTTGIKALSQCKCTSFRAVEVPGCFGHETASFSTMAAFLRLVGIQGGPLEGRWVNEEGGGGVC